MYYSAYYNNLSITITKANVAFRCSNPVIRAHYRVLRRQIRLCLRYQLSPHFFPKYASRKARRMLQPGTALFLLAHHFTCQQSFAGAATKWDSHLNALFLTQVSLFGNLFRGEAFDCEMLYLSHSSKVKEKVKENCYCERTSERNCKKSESVLSNPFVELKSTALND